MNLKQSIGLQVRVARTRQGRTQEQLAELINRTVETVSNIERGKTLPTIETLQGLGGALDVPLRDFFDEEMEARNVPRRRMELELRIRELARTLSDDDLDIAVDQIEALAKRGQLRS